MFVPFSVSFTVPCSLLYSSLYVIGTEMKEMEGDHDLVGTACLAISLSGKLKPKKKGARRYN